jgi:thiosulfate/3-mercaptopyruvate sulfurtransferase
MTFDELLRVRMGRKGSDLHKGITEMTMKKRALWAFAAFGLATTGLSAADPVPRLVGPDWLAANLSNPKVRTIDTRPAELYSGEKGTWKRKGHVQGAVHHVWVEDLNDNGTWKGVEVLRKAYADIGVTPDMAVIVSCGHGQMSAHTYFILKYVLGFPKVRNYDGGFNEWSNVDALPVESQ